MGNNQRISGYPFRSLEAGPGAWFDSDVLGVLEVHGENQWVQK